MLETEEKRQSFIESAESLVILCVVFYVVGTAVIFVSRLLFGKPWLAPGTSSAIAVGLAPLWLVFSITAFIDNCANSTGFYNGDGFGYYLGWVAITFVVCYAGVGLYHAELARTE